MTITSSTCGVWTLDDSYKKISAGKWATFDTYIDDTPPGQLWATGKNVNGMLGDNSIICRSSPIQIPGNNWFHISAGRKFSLATKSDGTLWSWGYGRWGTLGNNCGGFSIDVSSPIQIPGTAWINSLAGYNHAFATKNDGTLWGWGQNNDGRVGDNTAISRSSPVQIPGTQWIQASARTIGSSLARKTDGTLWSWGYNGQGQLGLLNTIGNLSSPTQIPGNQWIDIASGAYSQIAIKSDNTLWAFGCNSVGQLGNNTTINRSSPTQIPGNQWCSVSAGYRSNSATKSDNTLWAWGNNGYGQIGDNTTITRSSPTQIPGTNWFCATRSHFEDAVLAKKSI